MTQVEHQEPAAYGITPKMARALADIWRIRILSELSLRPLSPSRFVEHYGGELSKISRQFRLLEDWGYIEVIEECPGHRQGAAIEHIYRGIQRAHFDTPTWTSVPQPDRDAISHTTIDAVVARVAEATQARTFDQEVDRHLSWDGVALDRQAWRELGERLDDVLDWLSDLEVESAKRQLNAETERIPTIVVMTAFRSPHPPRSLLQASRRYYGAARKTGATFAISPKVVKALSNKWRCRILMEVSARPLSPSQFLEEVGGTMTHIARCFRELADWGFIEVLEERKGGRHGGGIERIYRGTHRPYFDTPTWSMMPRILREEMSQSFLSSFFERIFEALDAGTFDAEVTRHLSWKPVIVDRTAWTELAVALDEILSWLPELEKESLSRTAEEEVDHLIPTISGLAAFRAPRKGQVFNLEDSCGGDSDTPGDRQLST
jgi:DNA-binding transcriptional ArsR family regulator